jgi:hypothetical protein
VQSNTNYTNGNDTAQSKRTDINENMTQVSPMSNYEYLHFIRFVSASAKFGICTVVGLNETFVEDKRRKS